MLCIECGLCCSTKKIQSCAFYFILCEDLIVFGKYFGEGSAHTTWAISLATKKERL